MLPKIELAPSGLPQREDMSVAEFYGVRPQDLPSVFEPIDFPPRQCRPVRHRRTHEQVSQLLKLCEPR